MLSSYNILSPQNGNPIVVPTQDIVLGVYYLTKIRPGAKGEGMIFADREEAIIAYDGGIVDLHARIKVRIENETIETSVGRVIFNEILPEGMPYYNHLLVKKSFRDLIYKMFRDLGNAVTAKFLDDLKALGYNYATKAGISISFSDMLVPEEKAKLIRESNEKVSEILNEHEMGLITDAERYNKIIDVWTFTTTNVSISLMNKIKSDRQGFNPLHMMVDSGARGSQEQVRQLAGMRGLMMKPQKSLSGQSGEIIENPIVANFKEGLSVLEYFISTHGARKGLADTALKTADAGYLTRRLCDVAQDVIVSEQDCGTIRGVYITALKDVEMEREPLAERITGRVANEDVYDPRTDEVIIEAGELIDEETAKRIDDASIDSVFIRTVLTCESKRGVCAKCYGRNLTTGHLVEVGESVGIIAAQSIGEPGTQLTLRTFHLGGTSSRIASQSQVESTVEGKVEFEKINVVTKKDFRGDVAVVIGRRGALNVFDDNQRQIKRYEIPYGAELLIEDGATVKKGTPLYNHDPYNAVILTDVPGRVRFVDFVENSTIKQIADEQTGHVQKVVIESKDKTLTPSIVIDQENGDEKVFNLPTGAYLSVEEGEKIQAGTALAKISKSGGKSRDITGGLPRVTELFEARSPHDPAIVSEIEGVVKFGARKKGSREIIVESYDGSIQKVYNVPYGKHILVQEGDEIPAGEKITDGPMDPHDILKIKGPNAVQEYLVNEIQDVYRLQGVKINDKHIEIIVRQMLRKLKVIYSGDTDFIDEDLVNKVHFTEVNNAIKEKVVVEDPGGSKLQIGDVITRQKFREISADLARKDRAPMKVREAEPATFDNVLLGITQSALSTESWISAASFQETTKVLTNAAIAAKVDELHGLKENVVMGHLIPAGTGLKKYRDIIVPEDKLEEENGEEKEVNEDEKASV